MATVISFLWPIALCRGRLAHLPADLVRPAAGGRGAVRADVRLILVAPWVFAWYTVVAWVTLDSGSAQPDDPVAGARRRSSSPSGLSSGGRRQSVTSQLKPRRRAATRWPGPPRASPTSPARRLLAGRRAGHRCGGTGWPPRLLAARAGAAGARPARLPARAVLHRHDEVPVSGAQGMDPVGYKGPLRAILLVGQLQRGGRRPASARPGDGRGHLYCCCCGAACRAGWPRWPSRRSCWTPTSCSSEQAVMPDTWFEALIVAGLAITARGSRGPAGAPSWPAASRWAPRPPFAQVGEVLILPAVIYLLVAGGGWRQAIGRAPPLCAAFALPHPGLLHRVLPARPGTSSCRTRASPRSTARMAAAADCATLRLPPAERGCARPRPSRRSGPDWLEYGDRLPIRPYYANPPRDETDRADRRLQPPGADPAAAAGGRRLRPRRGEGVRADPHRQPGDTPISRWQFQTAYPYCPPHATGQIVAAATARFGGARPLVLAGRSPASCAPTSSAAATPPSPVLALCTPAWPGSARPRCCVWRAGPRSAQPAPGLPAAVPWHSQRRCCWCPTLFEFSWRFQLPALVTLVRVHGALGITIIVRSGRGARPRFRQHSRPR